MEEFLRTTIVARLQELMQTRNVRSMAEFQTYEPLLTTSYIEYMFRHLSTDTLVVHVDALIRMAEILDGNPLWLVFGLGRPALREIEVDDPLEHRISTDFRRALSIATKFVARWPHTVSRLLTLWRALDHRRKEACNFPTQYAAKPSLPRDEEEMREFWNLLFPRNNVA